MEGSHLTPVYSEEVRTGKGLLGLALRNLGLSLKTLAPLLLIFLVIGLANVYLARVIDDHFARVLTMIVLGLLNGFFWCIGLCLLHQRYVGHTMPLAKASQQVVRHYFNTVLVVVCYGAFVFIYYEANLLVHYVFGLFAVSKVTKLAMMAVTLVLCFLYIAASVMLIMGFASTQIEKLPIVAALKRSNQLVQSAWMKSFLQYMMFAVMLLIVLMPQSMAFASDMPLLHAFILQAVFALVVIPLWLSWYLLSYNDLKLSLHSSDDD